MEVTDTNKFVQLVLNHYNQHGRDLPWRQPEQDSSFDPYKILVSEMMLQQTQVPRVLPKYEAFIKQFPSVSDLAAAPLSDVLRAWSGLGYNRRTKYLHESAKILKDKLQPWKYEDLVVQKGIGKNTAAAVVVYAYDLSLPFIETNVRTAIIHQFFNQHQAVSDKEVAEKLNATLKTLRANHQSPRIFYWALMDWGTHLKKTYKNPDRQSKTYTKQSAFQGSQRQIRGKVLKLLVQQPLSHQKLKSEINDTRFETVIRELMRENLIEKQQRHYQLHSG